MLKSRDIDGCFRALADPTRRAIVERLGQGPASVSDLARPFPVTLAAIVQHLGELEAVGLVETEKVGRVRTCRLAAGGLATVADWIDMRRAEVERRLDRLGEILGEPAPPATDTQGEER